MPLRPNNDGHLSWNNAMKTRYHDDFLQLAHEEIEHIRSTYSVFSNMSLDSSFGHGFKWVFYIVRPLDRYRRISDVCCLKAALTLTKEHPEHPHTKQQIARWKEMSTDGDAMDYDTFLHTSAKRKRETGDGSNHDEPMTK